MIPTPLVSNTLTPAVTTATARLQIKYVSRLPAIDSNNTALSPIALNLRQRSPSLTSISATVLEHPSSQKWTISTTIMNLSSPSLATSPERHNLSIYAWPMFAPEEAKLVASTAPSSPLIVPAGEERSVDIDVQMRDLAIWRDKGTDGRGGERARQLVLQEGMYMFEVRSDLLPSMGGGILKQVCVVGDKVLEH